MASRRLGRLTCHLLQHPNPSPAASTVLPFKIVFLGSSAPDGTPRPAAAIVTKLREQYGSRIVAVVAETTNEAVRELADADAAYGALTATLLAAAPKLKWIQCPMAAPPESYFIPELIQRAEIEVTNMRGIYDEELSVHILTLMLAVNRQLGDYHDQQRRHEYTRLTFNRGEYTPNATREDFRVDIPRWVTTQHQPIQLAANLTIFACV